MVYLYNEIKKLNKRLSWSVWLLRALYNNKKFDYRSRWNSIFIYINQLLYNNKINLFTILNNALNKRTKLKDENESRVYYPLQYVNVGQEIREFVRNIFYGLFNLLVFDKIIVSNRKSFSFIFSYYNLHYRYFLLLSLFRSIGVAIN